MPDAGSAIVVKGDSSALAAIPDTVPGMTVAARASRKHIPASRSKRTLLLIQVFLVVIAAGIIAAFFYIITLQKMPELA